MKQSSELKQLVGLLCSEHPDTMITFREESARDIRYTLVVATDDNALLRKLAQLFGCPARGLPGPSQSRFDAADSWHGRGEVDLRDLADEFIQTEGEFFDFDVTLRELRLKALAV